MGYWVWYRGGGALLQLFLRLGSIHKSQMNGFLANPPRYEFYYRFKDLFFATVVLSHVHEGS